MYIFIKYGCLVWLVGMYMNDNFEILIVMSMKCCMEKVCFFCFDVNMLFMCRLLGILF